MYVRNFTYIHLYLEKKNKFFRKIRIENVRFWKNTLLHFLGKGRHYDPLLNNIHDPLFNKILQTYNNI